MRPVRHGDHLDVAVRLPAGADVQITLRGIRPWRDTLRIVAVLAEKFDPANDAGDGALFVYGAGDRAPGEPREHAFDGIIDLHADRPADVVHLYVTDIDGAVVDPALLELGEVDVAATPAP